MNIAFHPRSPSTLRKRDGRLTSFDPGKIQRTLRAAGLATGEFDSDTAETLANLMLTRLVDRDSLDVDDVQDVAERGLMEAGYYATARAYIVFHERHKRLL